MKENRIKDFNKKTLTNIIDGFAKQGRIFANEAQFQHELAMALDREGYKVHLEVLSTSPSNYADFKQKPKSDREKFYTDIVIEFDNNNYVAIELKYKTDEASYKYNNVTIQTFPQGAYDNGTYDFLKDVERIERFVSDVNDNRHIDFNFDVNKKVVKGYALILTNDNKYLESRKETSPWFNFSLTREREIKGALKWRKKGTEKDIENADTFRGIRSNCIHLENKYTCDWKKYEFSKNCTYKKEFNYLIFEIPSNT